ncbi:MAG: preprotein translocase subunit SecY, partial [Candidatus Pacebacteria bacterium]|nr:preprotein translocase subunit SecY [Candidatus Paceibacterota bacterium]
MDSIREKISILLKDKGLRKKILFILAGLAVFRLLASVPVPGVDQIALESFLSGSQFFGLLNVFSGGGLSNLSIVMLGVGPYITASIIMQLLTIVFPRIKEMYQEEGEAGRRKFMQYSRLITVPLAVIQGFSFLVLLERQGIIGDISTFDTITNVLVVTAGSMLVMWIGELMTEFGIGNGVSIIIFAGIVAALPGVVSQMIFTFEPSQIPLYIAFLFVAFVIILGVVLITEAERPIPVTYAKRVRGQKMYGGTSTYLPLRINQAGVIPIIFALSILLFPQVIVNILASANVGGSGFQNFLVSFSDNVLNNLWIYGIAYFILVFLFTYFYTAVTFDPEQISKNLQRSGAFVPGVRPGQSTSDYISKILTRVTLVGAVFLGFIAVLPIIMQGLTGFSSLTIGGTALLIVVIFGLIQYFHSHLHVF